MHDLLLYMEGSGPCGIVQVKIVDYQVKVNQGHIIFPCIHVSDLDGSE